MDLVLNLLFCSVWEGIYYFGIWYGTKLVNNPDAEEVFEYWNLYTMWAYFKKHCYRFMNQKIYELEVMHAWHKYKLLFLYISLHITSVWNKYRSYAMREDCRLTAFENRVQRRIFGPTRDKVKGEWWKLHNEVLSALHFSPNIIQVLK